jgi:hypothetical protein
MVTMTAKEVLNAAANRIEKLGWCQGSYGVSSEGKPCRTRRMGFETDVVQTDLLGAIRFIDNREPGDEAKSLVQTLLSKENLADWNDDPKRTKEQVIALLRKAAK